LPLTTRCKVARYVISDSDYNDDYNYDYPHPPPQSCLASIISYSRVIRRSHTNFLRLPPPYSSLSTFVRPTDQLTNLIFRGLVARFILVSLSLYLPLRDVDLASASLHIVSLFFLFSPLRSTPQPQTPNSRSFRVSRVTSHINGSRSNGFLGSSVPLRVLVCVTSLHRLLLLAFHLFTFYSSLSPSPFPFHFT
jgi:hypothetical protein